MTHESGNNLKIREKIGIKAIERSKKVSET
jgi:hypothetical protein